MPLLKLWNSLRGRSAPAQAVNQPVAQQLEADAATADNPPSKNLQRSAPAKSSKGGSNRGFHFFGGGPHAGLCKLVKSAAVSSSVLEVSVEDGSRAIAMLESLVKTNQRIHYLAIDQFELDGGGVQLKQFHQKLRGNSTLQQGNVRTQLFPETVSRGLARVAHTIGSVDLVVIAAPIQQWQDPATRRLLARISHEQTTLLYLEQETWKRLPVEALRCEPGSRRAA